MRNEFYTQENKRLEIRKKFSYEKYLESLNLEMNFGLAKKFNLERLAQLTQKTNQFNLTLERLTLNEIQNKNEKKTLEFMPFP